MPRPTTGQPAPDFTLPGTSPDGPRDYTLSAARGRPVVLAFYPGDETLVCTRQLCSYQSDLAVLAGLDAVLWGISSQGVASHEKFAAHRGLTFPLLADEDKQVHRAYGVDGLLVTKRALFVVDPAGDLFWQSVSRTGLAYKRLEEVAAVLRGLDGYPSEPPAPKEHRAQAD